MMDGLDAVAVRVEQEGSVVIVAVLGSRTRCAVVSYPAPLPTRQKASASMREGAIKPT
jgi:hypothetical protein